MGITKYYVDVENTGLAWLPLLGDLEEGDVIALYTSKHTSVTYGDLIPALPLLRQGRLDIREGYVRGRGDSALDYFLMGEVMNDVRRNPEIQAVIVSNDRGYDDFIKELTYAGLHAKRVNWPWEYQAEPETTEAPASMKPPDPVPVRAPDVMRSPMHVPVSTTTSYQPPVPEPVPVLGQPADNEFVGFSVSPVQFTSGSGLLRPLNASLNLYQTGAQPETPAPVYTAQDQQASVAGQTGMRMTDAQPAQQPLTKKQEKKMLDAARREYIRKSFEVTIHGKQGRTNYLSWFDCGKLADSFIRNNGDFEMVLANIADKHKRQILGSLIPRDQRERLRSVLWATPGQIPA